MPQDHSNSHWRQHEVRGPTFADGACGVGWGSVQHDVCVCSRVDSVVWFLCRYSAADYRDRLYKEIARKKKESRVKRSHK